MLLVGKRGKVPTTSTDVEGATHKNGNSRRESERQDFREALATVRRDGLPNLSTVSPGAQSDQTHSGD